MLERNIFSNISSIMVVSKFGNLILQQSLFKDTFWHVLKMLALSSINVKILQWSTKNYAAKIKCRKHITIWLVCSKFLSFFFLVKIRISLHPRPIHTRAHFHKRCYASAYEGDLWESERKNLPNLNRRIISLEFWFCISWSYPSSGATITFIQ